jgi:hypothetical protein
MEQRFSTVFVNSFNCPFGAHQLRPKFPSLIFWGKFGFALTYFPFIKEKKASRVFSNPCCGPKPTIFSGRVPFRFRRVNQVDKHREVLMLRKRQIGIFFLNKKKKTFYFFQSKGTIAKREKRAKQATIDEKLEAQFKSGSLFAVISSRPGQCGRADGYLLEGPELAFYLKKMDKKKKH